jgi:hypothetical protein
MDSECGVYGEEMNAYRIYMGKQERLVRPICRCEDNNEIRKIKSVYCILPSNTGPPMTEYCWDILYSTGRPAWGHNTCM